VPSKHCCNKFSTHTADSIFAGVTGPASMSQPPPLAMHTFPAQTRLSLQAVPSHKQATAIGTSPFIPPSLPPPPRYQDYQASDIPVVEDSSTRSRVRVMAGSHAGVTGPFSMVSPGLLMDVVLQPGGSVRLEVPQDWTRFAYVYDGKCVGGRGGERRA
jgi:hypothetical protein